MYAKCRWSYLIVIVIISQSDYLVCVGTSFCGCCHHLHTCHWPCVCMLRPCPTLGLIRLLWSHCSSVAQLRSLSHLLQSQSHSYTSVKHDTWSIPHSLFTTPRCLPCSFMSSPCSRYILHLVSFSLDLVYFTRT